MASYWVYLSSEVSANRVVIVLSGIVICDDADPRAGLHALLALAPDVGHGDGPPVLRGAGVPGQGARPVGVTIAQARVLTMSPVPPVMAGPPPGADTGLLALIGALGARGDGAAVATGRCRVSFVTQFKFKCFHFLREL